MEKDRENAGKKAQLVKSPLCKYDNLRLTLTIYHLKKKPRLTACVYNPSTGDTDTVGYLGLPCQPVNPN